MSISTQLISAYTFVTELSIIHSLNFSYKSGVHVHNFFPRRAITLCTELSICQYFCTWTEHPSQNEPHILLIVHYLITYMYLNWALSTTWTSCFAKGKYCLQLKNLNLHAFEWLNYQCIPTWPSCEITCMFYFPFFCTEPDTYQPEL